MYDVHWKGNTPSFSPVQHRGSSPCSGLANQVRTLPVVALAGKLIQHN